MFRLIGQGLSVDSDRIALFYPRRDGELLLVAEDRANQQQNVQDAQ
jgi:hypothetical protein